MIDPTLHWPEVAREFLTCSIHFIHHQNFGFKTCCYWNNFTCGVHFALIIHFSFQSLPLYPHQKTSQASSLAWRLAVRAVGSISLCASLWSRHDDSMWFAPVDSEVTCCCGSARQQEILRSCILVDSTLCKTPDFSQIFRQFRSSTTRQIYTLVHTVTLA